VNLKVEDYYPSENGFYSALKKKTAKRRRSRSIKSWKRSSTSLLDHDVFLPSGIGEATLRLARRKSSGRLLAARRSLGVYANAEARWSIVPNRQGMLEKRP
jgi:hypothetical protein